MNILSICSLDYNLEQAKNNILDKFKQDQQ